MAVRAGGVLSLCNKRSSKNRTSPSLSTSNSLLSAPSFSSSPAAPARRKLLQSCSKFRKYAEAQQDCVCKNKHARDSINRDRLLTGQKLVQGSSPRHALELYCLARRQLCYHTRKHLPRRRAQGVTHAVHSGARLHGSTTIEVPELRSSSMSRHVLRSPQTARSQAGQHFVTHLRGKRCKISHL